MKKINIRSLRLSLKFRPEILRLILKMRMVIRKKKAMLVTLQQRLKATDCSKTDQSTQTDTPTTNKEKRTKSKEIATREPSPKDAQTADESAWTIDKDTEQKSIAEQVKEAAQDAMKQSGMVYVESAGMYYDYKTGYYYNSELGLYYHTDTGCYYYYSDEKQTFVFHSYPDRSATDTNAALLAHEKRKARKHKMERKKEDDIENLTKNLSQGNEDGPQKKKKKNKKEKPSEIKITDEEKANDDKNEDLFDTEVKEKDKENGESETLELEDGECSDSNSDNDEEDRQSNVSTSTASDDDAVAKHHPPCMRVIVRETSLPKLKVGSLFIVTKDGGTVGREGEQHTILLRDHNVSRNHLDIRYDENRRSYMARDMGSKNGSILNGSRISESQVYSDPVEIVHGSTLQLGETKLLCHIHPGNDTCGHCEPGLLMEAIEKEKKVAYTRTCSVQMQHQLELARLKNKYAPQPLAIEETAYNDRAQARREKVGSSHHAEKTQATDVDTFIAPENKGFKLLEKMGWSKGEGLGKDNQGDVEPVPLVSNDGTAGLGAARTPKPKPTPLGQATLRLANRTKILKPPAKAFQQEDEESESEE